MFSKPKHLRKYIRRRSQKTLKGQIVMNKQIVILGSINYDITASAERLPVRGETVSATSVDMFGGGKGANQAVQSAQMAIPTTMIGPCWKL